MSAALHALALAATNLGLAADVWSDWSLLDSRAYDRLHAALVARLPARAPLAIAALDAATATRRDVLAASEDFTRPMVLRGALRGLPCTAAWGDPQWWLDRYPDAELLCSSAGESRMLPVREALARPEVYVAGATTVFQHHPELKDMVETELTRAITPDRPGRRASFYQLFLGRSNQGTTVHCAMGINLFRQIAGRKRWYFIPPSQTPFLRAKVYANGYSATSRTIQPHEGDPGSPWFDRLLRYTAILEPGDLLINPPWWWHCVENLPSEGLVVGVPTRFAAGRRIFRVDAFKSALAFTRVATGRSGIKFGGKPDPAAFERSLIQNRDETDQQLVLVPGRLPTPAPTPVDWADRGFAEFRRLVPARPMVLALALALDGPPSLAELRAGVLDLVREAPRLRCHLEAADADPATLRWVADPAFRLEEHLVERVLEGARGVEELLRPAAPRLGEELDWRRSPWRLEVIRDQQDPAAARFFGLRLCWDHALTDMEGMYLALLRLGGTTCIGAPEPEAMLGASGSSRERPRRDEPRAPTLALAAGSRDVSWTHLRFDRAADEVAALARARGITSRELLLAWSAAAFRAHYGHEQLGFDIMAPSYSARPLAGPLALGNHFRQSTRFSIPPGGAALETIVDAVSRQAARARGVPYGASRRLALAPEATARRMLSRLPPLIVNWDAPRLSEQLTRMGGARITDFAVATPLLPHQHCSFIWWVREGALRCGISADRLLIPDPEALAEALRTTLREAS
ncbi:MAG: cupin-like domain-containing protein [Myxococcales bacterium]|nr:cupin-like domain-containing protein [Myxococcales bacterium]